MEVKGGSPTEGEAGSNSLEEGSHEGAVLMEGKEELERESSFFDF